ncbi:hypothetical protein B0T26DRAFT_475322 [Lasiosphaeria miniovina]|uniref:Uncharacterized protein n=1 Tax=Lasiosphaeria miniovina TaxID=1954250 RepID=A0AA40A039_9PEZI|nr:uncharacterized protein B0T26DRAFT_475322 [Lasiosphaeria miniovina]KAK0706826.1 hypothetical protein B0T26DRAFT_475322 [Lasiosphaeria miniovina]
MRRNNNAGGAPRRRPTEFRLPDGRKVVVARLPEDAETLRRRYSTTPNNNNNKESTSAAAAADEEAAAAADNNEEQIDVEVVVHGSDEHRRLLREAQAHHLDRLQVDVSVRVGNASFSRFGFDAKLRMYDDDDDRDGGDDEVGGGGSDGYSVPVSRSPSFAAGDSDGCVVPFSFWGRVCRG